MADWDVIALRGLTAAGSHGVFEFERSGSQDFVADILLYVDVQRAATTDDVDDTVDYSAVADGAVKILTGPSVYLIETLASRLAELALSFAGVAKAQVTVHKPMAPLAQQFTDVSVTVVRERRGVASGGGRHRARQEKTVVAQPVRLDPNADTARTATLEPGGGSLPVPAPAATVPPAAPASARPLGSDRPARIAREEDLSSANPTVGPAPDLAKPDLAKKDGSHRVNRDSAGRRGPAKRSGRHSTGVKAPQFHADPTRPQRQVYDVVLALGANQGDVIRTLRDAVEALGAVDGLQIDAVSPLVETLPVLEPGALPQENYFNAVVLGRTVLAPPALLLAAQRIEKQFGRTRKGKWGPRTLDIDVIDVDHMTLDNSMLTLPHPRASSRAFVLYPWLQANADASLPKLGPVSALLPKTGDLGGVLAEYPEWLDADGNQTGPGRELHLAPRAPSREREPVVADSPRVKLRGIEVGLASVEEDPIFQRMLVEEEESARRVSRARAQAAPPAQVPPPPEPRPVAPEPVPVRQIPMPMERGPVAPAPEHVRGEEQAQAPRLPQLRPALPDWNFAGQATTVRVIDSFEDDSDVLVEEVAPLEEPVPAAAAASEPSVNEREALAPRRRWNPVTVETATPRAVPRLARDVTVRPAPTGSVPLTRPATRSKQTQR